MIRAIKAWDRFWFTPADPTLLGLIRICCGLVILYVHLAYTYDLQEFFGEHAWLDLQTMNTFRHDSPVARPLTGWDDGTAPLGAFKSEDERQAAEDYIVRWGVDPRSVRAKGQPLWSIWFHVTDPKWMLAV